MLVLPVEFFDATYRCYDFADIEAAIDQKHTLAAHS
jgi:hypothetical protein